MPPSFRNCNFNIRLKNKTGTQLTAINGELLIFTNLV